MSDEMQDEFLADLIDHRTRVAGYMQLVANELFRRACVHDNSKFSPAEYDYYRKAFHEFQKHPFGTPGYKAAVQSLGPGLEHHLTSNDHHPEFFAGGVGGMNLIQVIEMVCDWIASSERPGKDVRNSLQINKERFGITDQLHGIIENTVGRLLDRK